MKGQLIAGAALLLIISLVGTFYAGKNIGASEQAASNAVIATQVAVETSEKLREAQKANDNIVNAWHEVTLTTSEKTNELQQKLKRLQDMSGRNNNAACSCVSVSPDNFSERLRVITAASDCESLGASTDKPIIVSDTDGLYGYTIGLASDRCRIAEQLKSLILTVRDDEDK